MPRSDADVIKLFEKIPGTSKLGTNERSIREFLSDKHGSHIIPRSQAGGFGVEVADAYRDALGGSATV